MSGLPANWSKVTLGDVITGFEAGRNLRASSSPASASEFGVLKISAVSWGKFQPQENKALLPGDHPMPRELVRKGDLLISRANTTELVGAPVLVDRDYDNLMLPDKILRVKYNARIVDSRYLLYALRTKEARAHIEEQATGTSDSMRNLSQPKLSAVPIRLAPLAEQKRIADKLDRLLAAVDTCKARLDAIPAILKRFRQSVLAAATSGELTEEWRGHSAMRVMRFDDDELTVPEIWSDVSLAELVETSRPLCYGVVQPGVETQGGVPLIRVQDLENGTVQGNGLRTISAEIDEEFRRSRVHADDVLVSLVGTIGRVAIVPKDLNANIARAIARIACKSGVLPQWVKIWIASDVLQWWLLRNAREVARKTLNLSELSATRVALPSVEEQREIATRVDALFALADELLGKVSAGRTHVDSLTQTLLSKAFRGELATDTSRSEFGVRALADSLPRASAAGS